MTPAKVVPIKKAPAKKQPAKKKAPTITKGKAVGSKRNQASYERAQEALDMRVRGLSYQRIADALGVTRKRAWELVQRELDAIIEENEEKAQQVLRMELDRLDLLVEKALERAIDTGDAKQVHAYIAVAGHRARLLGLDVKQVKADITARWETFVADTIE